MSHSFDAIIVGAGQAGPPLAGRLSDAGMKVALVERKLFGGTCVNTGCTPTKALVASANAPNLAGHAADYGVHLGGGSPWICRRSRIGRRPSSVTPARA